ncbi:hypothetical protein KIL84_009353 [Mauremys mutica]|uniref:Uncharacterized protein n=1 Tax=Mauremys mutica TaxID=74926 RepID=A0A9D3XIF0_9SAUR|nr:hypothetical protein KIL84_009353 [Mauremys mutica]
MPMATALGDTLASRWKIPPPWGKVLRVGLGMLEGDLPAAQLEPAPEELLLQVKLWGVRSGHMGARLPGVRGAPATVGSSIPSPSVCRHLPSTAAGVGAWLLGHGLLPTWVGGRMGWMVEAPGPERGLDTQR